MVGSDGIVLPEVDVMVEVRLPVFARLSLGWGL